MKILSSVLCIALISPVTLANEPSGPMLNFSAGQFGIDDDDDIDPHGYGIEYRNKAFTRWDIVPAIGVAWAQDGAKYFYTDIRRHFWLNEHWVLTPSFGPGIFQSGGELHLGHTLEFRSGLELARRFEAGYRVGVILYHLSNGSMSSSNPGTNALMFSITLPL